MKDDVLAKNWHVTARALKMASEYLKTTLRRFKILGNMPTGPTPTIAFLIPTSYTVPR